MINLRFDELSEHDQVVHIAKHCLEIGMSSEDALELIPKDDLSNANLTRELLKFEMDKLSFGYCFN